MTNTQIVAGVARDEYASYGRNRPPADAAESYGLDVVKMIRADLSLNLIELQAHCAGHFGRLALALDSRA